MEKGNKKFHILDRYAGIPIVFFLGLFKKNNDKPQHLNRIAILNIGSIGDNVLMSAAIADLRVKYPKAVIEAFTGGTNYEIVKLIDGINKVTKLPITNPLATVKILKSAEKFDVVFDFGPWPRLNAIYAFFTPAKYRIGFKSPKQYRHYVYNQTVEHKNTVHEIDNHRTLISDFVDGERYMPQLTYTPVKKVQDFIVEAGNYCIIHPWAGGLNSALKQWDNKRWAELIYAIAKDFDSIIITGAPADIEDSSALVSLIDTTLLKCNLLNVAGLFNIPEVVQLVDYSQCVICVDTGVSHIAAALDKKLICLQGPASSLRWRPYNDTNAIVINPDSGTYGYLSFGYEYDKAKEHCMDNIKVTNVFSAYERLMVKIEE